jgi:amino-acid N-acetyltransferase
MQFVRIPNGLNEQMFKLLKDNNLSAEGLLDDHVLRYALIGNQQLIGIGALTIFQDEAMLRSVSVNKDHQENGVGRSLVQQIIREARSDNLNTLYLLTDTAEGFFKKLGFKTISRKELPVVFDQDILVQSACSLSSAVMKLNLT